MLPPPPTSPLFPYTTLFRSLLSLVQAFGLATAANRKGGRRARLWAESHRPGDRVRLLLRARGEHVPRARVRGRPRKPQPGNGVDGLRHVRSPLPRAADTRANTR